ncbi:MAG: hypothetical protein PWQ96_1697 [Clostridia bacterium]|jgi:methylated-DNA-[protein]-cysteine S-methyltransferase|nr:hypothetical protein [Clostridiales bacterium]MDK2986054.1 hypothetical protein [Clostridia bacterium]
MSLKNTLKKMLEEKDFAGIVQLGIQKRSTLKYLQVFLYDLNSVLTWRAIEALGLVCGSISQQKPELVRDIIRRFFWSLNDESGGTPWSSAQVIGEIIRHNPKEYQNFISNLACFLEDENIRGYVLWALGRIALKAPELIEEYIPEIEQFLNSKDQTIKGFAAFALHSIGTPEAKEALQKIEKKDDMFSIYLDGELQKKRIKEFCL